MALTPQPISIDVSLSSLQFLAGRSPNTTTDESAEAFASLAQYRDGAIHVAHWAGTSEWERHPAGDEIVLVVEGETTIFFLDDDADRSALLRQGELVVVPQGTWHRFETPVAVKVLSVTPQPSDHSVRRPG